MAVHYVTQGKNSLNISNKAHTCITRIPKIMENWDDTSNTNKICNHRNKEQSEYFNTNMKSCVSAQQ